MQLETDQHWYALFGFFYSQQTDEQKLELLQPWTREKVLVELFDLLKNGRDDRLKINLLIFLEENSDFFFSSSPTVYQGTCTLLNELLTLPTEPKIIGNIRDPSAVNYAPYAPNSVKTQVLTTLTTILLKTEESKRSYSAIESLIDILFDIVSHVNDSHDRILRQTAAEVLRELSHHFSGLLSTRLEYLFKIAQTEVLHTKQSYILLFSTVFVSTLSYFSDCSKQIINSHSTEPISSQLIEFSNQISTMGLNIKFQHGNDDSKLLFISSQPQLDENSFHFPLNNIVYRPFKFNINVTKPNHLLGYFKRDAIEVVNFLLSVIPILTTLEAVRVMQHITFIIQSVIPFPKLLLPSLRNNSTIPIQDIPFNFDYLHKVLKWSLSTHSPILWTLPSIIFSRIPYTLFQSVQKPNQDSQTPSPIPISSHLSSLENLFLENLLQLPKMNLIPLPLRIAMIDWITQRPLFASIDCCEYIEGSFKSKNILDSTENPWSVPFCELIYSSRKRLFPSPLDPLSIIYSKIQSLAYIYSNEKLPSKMTNIFTSYSDFVYPNNSQAIRFLFNSLRTYIARFPSFYSSSMGYILKILEKYPQFVQNVWNLTSKLIQTSEFANQVIKNRDFSINSNPSLDQLVQFTKLGSQMVASLCNFLSTLPSLGPKLTLYFPLIKCLIQSNHSNVNKLLASILIQLRSSESSLKGWTFGNALLELIQYAIIHHDSKKILTQCYKLLAFINVHFSDIEIRDRSNFYLQLLTHVPSEKIKSIIDISSKSESENYDVNNPFLNNEASYDSRQSSVGQSLTFSNANDPQNSHYPNLLFIEKISPYFNFNSLAHYHNGGLLPNPLLDQDRIQSAIQEEISPFLLMYYHQLSHVPIPVSIIPTSKSSSKTQYNMENGTHDSFMENNTDSKNSLHGLKNGSSLPNELFSVSTSRQIVSAETTDNSNLFTIQIPMKLRFKTLQQIIKEKSILMAPNLLTVPLSLYSLTLQFTGSNLYCSFSHSVIIPYLTAPYNSGPELEEALIQQELNSSLLNPDQNSSNELGPQYGHIIDWYKDDKQSEFPYSFSFLLNFRALLPLPTQINVSAVANTESGSIVNFTLDEYNIELSDFFSPLPSLFCPSDISYSEFRQKLFYDMWNYLSYQTEPISIKNYDKSDTPSKSSLKETEFINASSSVKYIEIPSSSALNKIKTRLEPYIIEQYDEKINTSEITNPITVRALIFLPHRYHLLLSINILPQGITIKILTDWWRLLAQIDRVLDDIFLS